MPKRPPKLIKIRAFQVAISIMYKAIDERLNVPFYTQICSFIVFVFISSKCGLTFGVASCLLLWTLSIVVNVRRGVIKCRLLDYSSLLFLIYFLLQSPVFPKELLYLEVVYFCIKFISLGLTIFQMVRWGLCSTTSFFILFLFISDTLFIHLVNEGIAKSSTEYLSIFETLLAALFSIQIAKMIFSGKTKSEALAINVSVLFLIGHFANYLNAGFAKLTLDGGVTSWLTNQTFSTIQRSELWGMSVVSLPLNQKYTFELEYLSNLFVLITQLFSGLVLFFPIIIGPLSIIYDLFHFSAGMLAGVWFYKWAAVNILIFYMRKELVEYVQKINLPTKVMLTSVFLFMYFFSSIPHLGWYEYRQGSLIYAYGIDYKGNQKRLHHQFFGSAAFSILDKGTFFVFNDHFPRQMGGKSFSEMKKANSCSRTSKLLDKKQQTKAKERLKKIVNRFLDDRSPFRKWMQNIQPYHILIPNSDLQGMTIESKFQAIKFELRDICLDRNYKVIKNKIVDTFVVEYQRYNPDNLRWPYFSKIKAEVRGPSL